MFDPIKGIGQVWRIDDAGLERERLQGAEQQTVGQGLVSVLMSRRGHLAPLEVVSGTSVPSYETFEQLAALGYVDADGLSEAGDAGGTGCSKNP